MLTIMPADIPCAELVHHMEDAREPLPPSLTRYTGFLVAKAHQRLWMLFSERCREQGMDIPCVGILHLLEECGPTTQQQLGRSLRIDRTTMVKMLDMLEKNKLAVRKDHPDDRRVYIIEITAAGRRALGTMQVVADEMEKNLLAQFTAAERKTIRRALLTLAG